MRHSTHALKSSLMLRLAACMVAIVAAMTSWAYDFNANGIYYNIIASSLSAEVTYASSSHNTYSGQVTIPAQVTNAGKTYKVTAVGDNAFRNCTSLTNVAIGSNVKRLGKRAFMGCTQLTQVDITAAVTEIDDYAFAQCSGLSTVRMLNDEPLEIGTGAFLKCNSLNNVKWISSDALDGKGGLISLGTNAFAQCTSLASIVLPGPLQFLGTTIFNGCSALNSVTVMNEQPLQLKGDPFALSPSTTIKVPSSGVAGATAALYQNAIGWNIYNIVELPYSFIDANHYTYLKTSPSTVALSGSTVNPLNVVVRKSIVGYNNDSYDVTSIASQAFKSSSIISLNTSTATKLKSIGSEAFAGCTNLANISLIEGINYMGERAFAGCTSLTSVQVPSTLRVIPQGAFEYCSALTDLHLLLGLSTIRDNAFAHCSSLQTVALPRSLTLVEPLAFMSTSSLTSVTVDPQCPQYAAFDGVLYERKAGENFEEHELGEMNALVLYPMCKTNEDYYIPCGVTRINEKAMQGASHLKYLAVPATTTSFGDQCFSSTGIETINYRNSEPTDVEMSGITASLKANATLQVPVGAKTTYQQLPEWNGFKAIVEIDHAYQDPSIVYDWNEKHQATIVNIKNTGIDSNGQLTIPANVLMSGYSYFITEMKNTCTAQVGSLIKGLVILSDSLSVIDTSDDINPLAAMTSIQSISISEGNPFFYMEDGALCNSVDRSLYYYLHSNTNQQFSLPPVKIIKPQAFAGNTHLKDISFSTALMTIEAKAFEGCTALEKISSAKYLTTIGNRAFAQCPSLSAFNGGERINTIGDEAFLNCGNLKSFPFDHGMIKTIGNHAFKGCSSLLGAVFSITLTSMGDNAFENCSSLNKVFFTSPIENIGSNIFKGCSNLSELWLCNTTAPTVGNGFFDSNVISSLKIFVPEGSESSYHATSPWSQASQVNTCSYLDNGADVNGDKVINANDISLIMAVLLGDDLSDIVGHFDVNHDGNINAGDITVIYNYILNGAETTLSYRFVNNDNENIPQNAPLNGAHLKIRAKERDNNQFVTTGLTGYIDNTTVATITPGITGNIPYLEIVPVTSGYCCLVAIVSDGSVCYYRDHPLIITP